MKFQSFKCKFVSMPVDDIYAELKGVTKLHAKHELICRTLATWHLNLAQNTTQLAILDETADILNNRHKLLTDTLALRPNDPAVLCHLQREIRAMEMQVDILIREIADISLCRKQIDLDNALNFLHQHICHQKELANVELATLDAHQLDGEHRIAWRTFLHMNQQQQQMARAIDGGGK